MLARTIHLPYTTLFRSSDGKCDFNFTCVPSLRPGLDAPASEQVGHKAIETLTTGLRRKSRELTEQPVFSLQPLQRSCINHHGSRSEEHTSELQSRFDLV